MNSAITIKQLQELCVEQIQKGYGDKKILLSNDDEWNGFHELFEGFVKTTDFANIEYHELPFGVDAEDAVANYIVLG